MRASERRMTRVEQEYLSSELPRESSRRRTCPNSPTISGKPLSHVGHTRVPEFPPRSRFENRKLEQASVSSPSSPECDEVLWSPLSLSLSLSTLFMSKLSLPSSFLSLIPFMSTSILFSCSPPCAFHARPTEVDSLDHCTRWASFQHSCVINTTCALFN